MDCDDDDPIDDEDRAVREIAALASKLRLRIAIVAVGLGVIVGTLVGWGLALQQPPLLPPKAAVLVGFVGALACAVAIAVALYRALLLRALPRWIAAASERHRVDPRSLTTLVRAGIHAHATPEDAEFRAIVEPPK